MPDDSKRPTTVPSGEDTGLNSAIPLVISGAPRSGTSLLYNLFDGHSQISWLVDEGFFFEYLHDLGPAGGQTLLDLVPHDIDALVHGLRDKQVFPPLDQPYVQSVGKGTVSEVRIEPVWDEAQFRAGLANIRRGSVAELWHDLVAAHMGAMDQPVRRFACLKAPDFGKTAHAAITHIGKARALIILRDPLRSLDSLKQSRALRQAKQLSWPALALYARNFQLMYERIDSLPPDRLMVLRYEDLVADVQGMMDRIADWAGLPFEDCLTQPTMRGQHWPGISSFEKTDGIDARPASRPLMALTPAEAEAIERQLSEHLVKYGYARG